MRKIAARLKELRKERNLSYPKIEKATGIPASTIFRIESGNGDVKGDQVIVLAKFFNVSAGYLLGLED